MNFREEKEVNKCLTLYTNLGTLLNTENQFRDREKIFTTHIFKRVLLSRIKNF